MSSRFAPSLILMILISTPSTFLISPQPAINRPFTQEARRFLVNAGETNVTIAVVDSISEKFAITINNNGGIYNIRISQMNFTNAGGWFIWFNAWQQLYGSNATSKPIVEEKQDYVSATFFAQYQAYPLAIVTNMIVSKNGVILINTNLTAVEDASGIIQIGWGFWFFPFSLFGGRYAEVCREGTVIRVELPAEYNSAFTSFYDTSRSTSWMDFSTISEGLTMINIAPSLFTGFAIGDNRNATSTDETFNAHFRLTGWGKGAMKKNEMRTARIALYIHEPGGYETNKDMIDLIVKIGETEDEAINAMTTYRSSSAKDFARQALLSARSAYEKIFAGNVFSAKSLLEEALDLIKRAEDAENSAVIVNNLLWLIPLLIIVATIIIIYVRRKKRR
ncbi:MAG: hypothetical protein QW385_03110 [Thermoproteota archaeon]